MSCGTKCLTLISLLSSVIMIADSATKILYDTKLAKTDLKWEKHPSNGWDELSGGDENNLPIRYHEICKVDEKNQDNWIRSPYINANSARRIYMNITYSIAKCNTCRETFTLYYYQADYDEASSTFPQWHENPYIKIDTVAAGTRFDASSASKQGINYKKFSIGPLRRKGIYIAVQDEGTCMSLIATKLYYHYCPETTHGLAYFPETLPGEEVASLVPVNGKCVSNAVYTNGVPKYRCNANGEWIVPTGLCQCRAGYYSNADMTACKQCKLGYYKSSKGNDACLICPPHSSSHSTGSTMCQCQQGYYRTEKDSMDQPCTKSASSPTNVGWKIDMKEATITWNEPSNNGGRNDVYYSITCSECDSEFKRCRSCPSTVRFFPSDHHHLTQTSVRLQGLGMFRDYRIKVTAHNGVSKFSSTQTSSTTIEFSTNENVPTKPLGLTALKTTSNSVKLSWKPPKRLAENVTGYEIHTTDLSQNNRKEKNPGIAPIFSTDLNFTVNNLRSSTTYEVKVRAVSDHGHGPFSEALVFKTKDDKAKTLSLEDSSDNTVVIIGVVGGIVFVILFIIVVVILIRRHRSTQTRKKENDRARLKMNGSEEERQELNNMSLVVRLPPLATSGRTIYTDYRDPQKGVREIAREIEFTDIKVEKVIGQGEFGEVCKGKLTEGKRTSVVAIKRLKRGATLIDQTNLFREACTMAQFNNPNILQLKGVITKTVPISIISEFMENGSLDQFLLANRGELRKLQLVKMLHGISSGMRYLSDMQYVHRDLAARNILVGEDHVCKVSDFGLSRNLENDPHATYTTQGGKIAIRWTAPECFLYREFTTASDVWSYGIVVWEVMSYGEKPYWNMKNEEVTKSIEEGYRLPTPQDCPLDIHRLMLDCWSSDASARPSFRELFIRMKRFVQQPETLVDRVPAVDSSSVFLECESPTSSMTVAKWLEIMKLGSYRQNFAEKGIRHLSEIVQLTADDLERLGITETVHRSRLQNGIQTLKRDISNDDSLTSSATLPMTGHTTGSYRQDTQIDRSMRTLPTGGAVGVGPVYGERNEFIV